MLINKKMSVFLGATFIAGLVGCGNEDASTNENDPISIMVHLQTPEVPDKKIQHLIEEKTDTKLDIQWVPASNFDERVNAAFATGTLSQVSMYQILIISDKLLGMINFGKLVHISMTLKI